MPNLFTPRADLVLRVGLLGVAALLVISGVLITVYGSPRWSMYVGRVREQPVMFSHKHHVGVLGLDCRYCHTSVEDSDFAGMPEPEKCMRCHSQLYTQSEMLKPIRAAWRTGAPVMWKRVYRLPDFVYFSHKVHVRAGVSCVSCHGHMDTQPMTSQQAPMQMGWCLDCHRSPEKNLVDFRREFDPTVTPGSAEHPQGRVDRQELLTNCSACHY